MVRLLGYKLTLLVGVYLVGAGLTAPAPGEPASELVLAKAPRPAPGPAAAPPAEAPPEPDPPEPTPPPPQEPRECRGLLALATCP